MLPIKVEKNSRILILTPHPDDECIGVGGIICKFAAQCHVILLTDGRHYNNENNYKNINIRHDEFVREMNYAKVKKYSELKIEDTMLIANINVMCKIDYSIYDIIFVTSRDDKHLDHQAAFYGLMHAIRQRNLNADIYEYEVWTPLTDVTDYLDVTDCIDDKMRLISFHESQLIGRNYKKMAKSLNGYRAVQCNVGEYLETYRKVNNWEDDGNYLLLNKIHKLQNLYHLSMNWLRNEIDKNDISNFLCEKGYKIIGIYGFSELGRILWNMLIDRGVAVKYILDRNADVYKKKYPIVKKPDEKVEKVDIVIVVVINEFSQISMELMKKGIKSISLSDIIMACGKNL